MGLNTTYPGSRSTKGPHRKSAHDKALNNGSSCTNVTQTSPSRSHATKGTNRQVESPKRENAHGGSPKKSPEEPSSDRNLAKFPEQSDRSSKYRNRTNLNRDTSGGGFNVGKSRCQSVQRDGLTHCNLRPKVLISFGLDRSFHIPFTEHQAFFSLWFVVL